MTPRLYQKQKIEKSWKDIHSNVLVVISDTEIMADFHFFLCTLCYFFHFKVGQT